jgi:hypothetical protein
MDLVVRVSELAPAGKYALPGGIVFEVVRPPEYAGRFIGVHWDGMGSRYDLHEIAAAQTLYAVSVPKEDIGDISMRLCLDSLKFHRQQEQDVGKHRSTQGD